MAESFTRCILGTVTVRVLSAGPPACSCCSAGAFGATSLEGACSELQAASSVATIAKVATTDKSFPMRTSLPLLRSASSTGDCGKDGSPASHGTYCIKVSLLFINRKQDFLPPQYLEP